jgi:hypothetical protein
MDAMEARGDGVARSAIIRHRWRAIVISARSGGLTTALPTAGGLADPNPNLTVQLFQPLADGSASARTAGRRGSVRQRRLLTSGEIGQVRWR